MILRLLGWILQRLDSNHLFWKPNFSSFFPLSIDFANVSNLCSIEGDCNPESDRMTREPQSLPTRPQFPVLHLLSAGMTNRPDLIDDALMRPGRFEVKMEISEFPRQILQNFFVQEQNFGPSLLRKRLGSTYIHVLWIMKTIGEVGYCIQFVFFFKKKTSY